MNKKLEEQREKMLSEEFKFGYPNHSKSNDEIEEYRDNLKANYRIGFDAAIALDLPVKFTEWYTSINKMGHETRVKAVKTMNLPHYPTIADFFQYYIDNVYKFE